jgi:hypothetical protein
MEQAQSDGQGKLSERLRRRPHKAARANAMTPISNRLDFIAKLRV